MNDLKHYGVAGMKWGVKKERVEVRTRLSGTSKRRKTLSRAVDGLAIRGDVALALYAYNGIKNSRTKRRVAKALNHKVGDLDKKQLKSAAIIVNQYSNVIVKAGDKSVKFR